MAEDNNENEAKIWSLEEIDELLNDSISTSASAKEAEERYRQFEKTRRLSKTRDDFIDPRPTYNAGIQHNIKTTKVEHSPTGEIIPPSSGGLENDRYRERFINKRIRNLEKTAEHTAVFGVQPEKPIERQGVIKRESRFTNTQDLAPLPTLVSPEEVLAQDALSMKTKVSGILDVKESEDALNADLADTLNQLKLEGFDDSEEPTQKIDEDEAERELYERRKKKVSEFSVSSGVLPESPEAERNPEGRIYTDQKPEKARMINSYSSDDNEFRFNDDKVRFTYTLRKRFKAIRISLIAESAAFVLLAAFGIIPLIGEEVSFDFFAGSEKIFLAICAVLAAIAFAAGYRILVRGFRAIVHLRPNSASCVMLAVFASVVQLIMLFFVNGSVLSSAPLYLSVAAAALLFNEAGELIKYKRIMGNFDFITKTDALYSVESIPDEDEAFEIGRGLLLGEPDIKASFRTLFPTRFMELSSKRFVSDELSRKLFPVITLLAVAVGIATAVIQKNAVLGVSAFAGAFCIGMPASAYLADNCILSAISKRLSAKGAMISGYEALDTCLGTNAVVLDANEIFDTSKCNIFGIKTFHSMRVDEAILYTAAMIIEADAPLSGIFDSVILGRRELLPPVETLAYEDKLGLSAWIHNRRVLVGNRDLLVNHNVETPNKEFEKKYLHDGRCPLYLAVEGKIAAMFIVSYEGNKQLQPLIRRAERNGVTLLIKTADANITEELICSSLRLPMSSTKVLNAVAGDVFDECRNEVRTSADAHILHDGRAYSMLTALCAVFSLGSFKNITSIVQVVGGAIGLAFTAILAFSSALSQIGSLQLIFYQLFWAVLTVMLLLFKNKR